MDAALTPNSGRESLKKIAWAVLIVLALYVCYFSHLGGIGLVGPDEPRYAWIARAMAESGDWVTPRLYGQPWFEKPVLYYWGAALSFKIFGVTDAAARLPSAFAALLATLGAAWFAFRVAGRGAARWVLVLLPTTIGMIGFSHAATPDMLFSATITLAMVCAAYALALIPTTTTYPSGQRVETPGNPAARFSVNPADAIHSKPSPQHLLFSLALFGFFLGAAVLAKGPAAVILAGGAILPWAFFANRWRDVLRLFHPIAIAAVLLTALPWYVLCSHRNPTFFHVFIVEHNFARYLTPQFQHIQPFWFYIPITFLALLPWTFWLGWFARREARTANESQRNQILFISGWALFPVLFFSISQSKLPGYILPAVPALGVLLSIAVTRSLKSSSRFTGTVCAAVGFFLAAFACWMAVATANHRQSKGLNWTVEVGSTLIVLFVVFASVGGLVICAASLVRRPGISLVSAVIVALILLPLGYVALGKLDPQISARKAALQIGAERASIIYSFKLQRGSQYQLNYYLHHEIPEWTPATPGHALVITSEKNLPELKTSAQIISVLWNRSSQAEILEVVPLPRDAAGGQPR